MKIFILTIFLALATVNAKPQLDLLKKVSDTVTGALDGCKGKESSFATKPGNYWTSFNVNNFYLMFLDMRDEHHDVMLQILISEQTGHWIIDWCERLHADIYLKLAGLPGTALDYFTVAK